MKCPYCQQEHPDYWRACPITGNKLNPTIKECPNCHTTGIPLSAKFCPYCQWNFNKTQASSKTVIPQTLGSPFEQAIKTVCGITIGETTLKDAEELLKEGTISLINYGSDGSVIVHPFTEEFPTVDPSDLIPVPVDAMVDDCIIKQSASDHFNKIVLDKSSNGFVASKLWEKVGFDWNRSFKDWCDFLKRNIACITEIEDPDIFKHEGNIYDAYAKISAKTTEGITMKLSFRANDKDALYVQQSTLYSIEVYSEDCDPYSDYEVLWTAFSVNENDIYSEYLSQYFPIEMGIVPGTTSVVNIFNRCHAYEDYDFILEDSSFETVKGHAVSYDDEDYIIHSISVKRGTPMPWRWKKFDWKLSYTEWIELFKRRGFDIEINDEPHTVYSREWEMNTLSAEFTATSPDGAFKFKLTFYDGEKGAKKTSPFTLAEIVASICD